ncbi:hypothetical protein [Clostridium sporogenes]|uniref:hypothetical protein n=1 Tax=Clostridium sporogenes TaxID=1509 RepID=UPI00024BA9E4|nr:hypothetical protein [Clostridium sporogenes]EHN13119.1 hypothetical protein IYC_20671 [Clostridium sporogenes PA 3679]MDU4597896.1 hypothetical protein [Clostridium sporogenes]
MELLKIESEITNHNEFIEVLNRLFDMIEEYKKETNLRKKEELLKILNAIREVCNNY